MTHSRSFARKIATGLPTRWKWPGFSIRRIEIVNIGTIDRLSVDLGQSQSCDFLFSANGIGKTTLLEAMSVLGHIPCFPVQGSDKLRQSVLHRFTEKPCVPNAFSDLLDQVPIASQQLDAWMSRFAEAKLPFGAIRFDIRDRTLSAEPPGNFSEHSCDFVVLVRPRSEVETPALTWALSRDRSSCLNDDPKPTPDYLLAEHFLVLHDKPLDSNTDFDRLELRIARGRTFSQDGVHHVSLKDIAVQQYKEDLVGEKRCITYINTDLNDFGRGNDLRESPKYIRESLLREVLDRFQVPFDSAGNYAHLAALNSLVGDILAMFTYHYSDVYATQNSLTISSFLRNGDEVDFKAKRDHGRPFTIDFLSAGENEVFFLILMCQVFALREGAESIVLLDEPDLHIANPMRGRFFDAIFEICESKVQLVSCTHSPIAIDMLRTYGLKPANCARVLYRRYTDDEANRTELAVAYDPRFLSKLWSVTSGSGGSVALWIKNKLMTLTGFWRPPMGPEQFRKIAGSALTLASISAGVAALYIIPIIILNDIFNVTEEKRVDLLFVELVIFPDNLVKTLLVKETVTQIHDSVRSFLVKMLLTVVALAIVRTMMGIYEKQKRAWLAQRSRDRD